MRKSTLILALAASLFSSSTLAKPCADIGMDLAHNLLPTNTPSSTVTALGDSYGKACADAAAVKKMGKSFDFVFNSAVAIAGSGGDTVTHKLDNATLMSAWMAGYAGGDQ